MQTQPSFGRITATSLSHASACIGFPETDQVSLLTHLAISPFDTITLDATLAGGIKEVREFTNQLLLSPQFGDIRLGVIYHADQLSPPAQNALLKILEEPPQRAKIILFIQTEASVLATVLSRCRRWYGSYHHNAPQAEVYHSDPLDQFLRAEELAKDENLRSTVQAWLQERYTKWCQNGRPAAGVSEVVQFWQLYQGLESQINRRLLLEQCVISSL